jgi:uncharacterized protein YoxC
VTEPLFWLGFSLLLVAVSLAVVLMTAIPAFQELSRASRSAEKLFDTLNREFPPTLEAIRRTNFQLTELSDELKDGVRSASGAVKQIDRTIVGAKKQVENAQIASRGLVAGVKAGVKTWQTFTPRRKKVNGSNDIRSIT